MHQSETFERQGVFPFLDLFGELRNHIYEYATTCTKPAPDDGVRMIHNPPKDEDFPDFTGFVLTCRQIYAEYTSCHSHSSKLRIYFDDVGAYIYTFFPPAREIRRELTLIIITQELNRGKATDVLPLLTSRLHDDRIKFSFSSGGGPGSHTMVPRMIENAADDLNALFNPSSPDNSPLAHLSDSSVDIAAIYIGGNGEKGWHLNSLGHYPLEITFTPESAQLWMDGKWQYVSNRSALIFGLDDGTIPFEYLSPSDAQMVTFMRSAGLHSLKMDWDISFSVAREESVATLADDPSRQGWVWEEENYDSGESWSEDEESEEESEEEGEEEGESFIEELHDELCWVVQHRRH